MHVKAQQKEEENTMEAPNITVTQYRPDCNENEGRRVVMKISER